VGDPAAEWITNIRANNIVLQVAANTASLASSCRAQWLSVVGAGLKPTPTTSRVKKNVLFLGVFVLYYAHVRCWFTPADESDDRKVECR
jgi:hypothetical protein